MMTPDGCGVEGQPWIAGRWISHLARGPARVLCISGMIFSSILAAPSRGQGPSAVAQLDSLLTVHSRVVELTGGTLGGPGGQFILDQGARAQFVALGEAHNTSDIPRFVTALFRALEARAGYHYYAEEQDPVTMEMISKPPRRGNRDSVVAVSRRDPFAYTFMADQELEMLADIGAASTARADPIWGCDQAFGATHILTQLIALPLSDEARAFATALRDTAAAKERVRDLDKYHYMAREPKSAAFAQLQRLVHAAPGTDADHLVRDLVASDRMYRNWVEGRRYDNGYEREEWMKSCFLDHYRRAEARDHAPPRVLLKFGHWHLFRGLGPSNLQTLGDFVSEFAESNRGQSFHIAIFANNPPGSAEGDLSTWSDSTPALLARRAPQTEWTIVDLRALRPDYAPLTAALSPAQRDNFRRWIFGFDAALFIGGLRPGTYVFNPGVKY